MLFTFVLQYRTQLVKTNKVTSINVEQLTIGLHSRQAVENLATVPTTFTVL